jgi:hypothetical protein
VVFGMVLSYRNHFHKDNKMILGIKRTVSATLLLTENKTRSSSLGLGEEGAEGAQREKITNFDN